MKLFFIIILFSIFNINVYAIGTGPAAQYSVTMKKMELCTGYGNSNAWDTSCSGPFVLAEKDLTFDVASVGVGAAIATYADTSGLPIGTTYTHARVTLNKDFTIKGYASSDDSGDGTTCWCRSETDGVFDSNTGKYLSRPAGVCESNEANAIANQEIQALWTNSRGTNRICQEAACSSSGQTDNVTISIEADGVDMALYGQAMNTGSSTSTIVTLVYKLSTPYTVGLTAPKISMSFGTATAFMSQEWDDDKCFVSPYYPKVNITITD